VILLRVVSIAVLGLVILITLSFLFIEAMARNIACWATRFIKARV